MTKFEQLRALREARAKKSDGCTKTQRAKTGNKAGAIPAEAKCSTATRFAREIEQGPAIQDHAGVVTRPSDTQLQKRGPGRPKIEEPRPWEAAGMSRRSWYRRKYEAECQAAVDSCDEVGRKKEK